METIEKLSHTLDFTDHASQIIHALVHVLDQSPELRPAAMETLCRMMTQLGQRYKIFIPMVKKVWEGGGRREGEVGKWKGKERDEEERREWEEEQREERRGSTKAGTVEQGERVDGGKGRNEGGRERRKRKSRGEGKGGEGKGGEGKGGEGASTKLHCDCHLLFPGDEQTSLLSHNV